MAQFILFDLEGGRTVCVNLDRIVTITEAPEKKGWTYFTIANGAGFEVKGSVRAVATKLVEAARRSEVDQRSIFEQVFGHTSRGR